ncbi:MAG: hypothetical protein JXA20_06550 [Spirochaetes bacterium]|nr:hypothetical protein [Spirochaetota bacterium]
MRKWCVVLVVPVLALGALACKKVPVDSELMGLIESAAKNCDVDTRYAFVKDCKAGEADKIEKIIAEKKVTPLLGTFTEALGSSDAKVKAVACKYLYRNYRDNIGELNDNRDKIPVEVVEAFINNVAATKEYVSFYVAELASHLAMMKGMETQLYKMLAEHPQEYTRLEGYRQLMRYGRLRVFDKVKELVGSTDEKVAAAAMEAPTNMYKITDQEKEQLCPWAQGFLSSENDNVATSAAKILNSCQGKYIDAVLDEAEKRANEGRLKSPFSSALTNFTFSCETIFGSPPTGTPEQCKRKEALIKRIAK